MMDSPQLLSFPALTATLKDPITVERGRVVQANFNDYDMIRMSEAPPIEVYLVPSSEAPSGIGEPREPASWTSAIITRSGVLYIAMLSMRS